MKKLLMTAAAALMLPMSAQAVVLTPGNDVEGDGDTLDFSNPTFAEILTADGDLRNLAISFTVTALVEDVPDITFGVSDTIDFDDATMTFTPVGSPTGSLQEGVGSIIIDRLNDGESIFILFDTNGTLAANTEADVGFTATAAPVPVPAAALLMAPAVAFGLTRRRKKAAA